MKLSKYCIANQRFGQPFLVIDSLLEVGMSGGTQHIETRLTLLDALRGCAAMAVVIYHIFGNLAENVQEWIPSIITHLIQLGFLGVPVFFVLSGFVISRSTDRDEVTLTYVRRFILRRSIRLDPPYWCSIAVAVAFMSAKNFFFPQYYHPLPTVTDVVTHIFYLQDILIAILYQ